MKDYKNIAFVSPDTLREYRTIAGDLDRRTTSKDIYIPKETGTAFPVMAGQVLRVVCVEGAQTADFNAFSLNDPSEHFWSGRTRTIQGSHLTTGDRLWSAEPKMRPMFTIIADTVEHRPLPNNAASHDLLYARCSAQSWKLQSGLEGHVNCNSNMMQALEDAGFPSTHVHDAFNIFMTTGTDENHRLFHLEPEAKRGDYLEMLAEIDSIVAISACPFSCNGDSNKGLQCIVYDQPYGLPTAR